MGGGRFDTKVYQQKAATYVKQDKAELFKQSEIFNNFIPLNITTRESCASKEHPDPTSIIIACDVTGSMGKIPVNLLKGGLGNIMESLMKIKSISNPQVMFAAIGDADHDKAPLQVTQFESDNRIEEQLKKLYLEGGGGGNNIESYHAIWYFAAYKTRLDSLKQGKKGILFTMGDEMVSPTLKADHIRKFIDNKYAGPDISTLQLSKEVSTQYEVFHLVVQDTSTYQQIGTKKVNDCWQQYLGERAILVPQHTDIPDRIISTVRTLCEMSAQATKSSGIKMEKEKPKNDDSATPHSLADQMNNFAFLGHKPASAPPSSSAAVLNLDSDKVPHLFKCAFTLEVMEDPVVAADGFTYERKQIEKWFLNHNTSPKTSVIIDKILIPNHDLRSEIIRWKEQNQPASSSLTPAGK